jgi:DNA-binding transcriptional ArsR family regulator
MSIQRCRPPADLAAEEYSEDAALFKALADPHRLTIVATLARAEHEVCVCDFTSGLPLNQPTVSHHLKTLRDNGIVLGERRGTWVYYRLAPGIRERIAAVVDRIFVQKVIA